MMTVKSYSFTKKVNLPFEEAVMRVTDELRKEGFGVLTEIDVKKILKKKIDVDFNPYIILGACNPPFAHKSLLAEDQIGLFLPCNVIVYINKLNETIVAAIDPLKAMQPVNNNDLIPIAQQVAQKLKKVIESV